MQDFFSNVSRYPRYFISFTQGVLYSIVKPLLPLFENRVTAVALIGAVVAGFLFLSFTLKAMLGLA